MTNKSDIDHIYQVSSPPKTAEMSWFADRVGAAELEEAKPWKATLRAPDLKLLLHCRLHPMLQVLPLCQSS